MKTGLFRIVVRLLFIGLGALSCVSLAAQGFHVRVGPVLNYLVGTEEIILQQIFGDLGQAAVRTLHNLSKYFHWGWSLHLDPAWKHIFVILWLYFKQDVQQLKDIADDTPSQTERLKKAAMISRISGIVIAVLSGFCAGLVDTKSGLYGSWRWRTRSTCATAWPRRATSRCRPSANICCSVLAWRRRARAPALRSWRRVYCGR